MDWPTSEMLLLGLDVEDFSLEKNIKPEKVLFKIQQYLLNSIYKNLCNIRQGTICTQSDETLI